MTPLVQVPAVQPEKEVSTYLAQAKSFKIESAEDLALVDAHCAAGLALKKKIEADFSPSKTAAHTAWKTIVAQEKGHLDGIEEGRKVDKALIDQWNTAQEAIAAEEARKAQAIEKKRLEDEALAQAARAEEFGDTAAADKIISQPVVVTPAPAYQAPKLSTVLSTRWQAVVEDLSLVPREYLVPNQTMLDGIARSTKGAIQIPGVKFVSRKV